MYKLLTEFEQKKVFYRRENVWVLLKGNYNDF